MFFGKYLPKALRTQCSYNLAAGSEIHPNVRRTSLFSSACGSLTLEAAIVLPLYLFFLITVIYIFNIMHIENTFQAAMEEAARSISSYAYFGSDINNTPINDAILRKEFLTEEIREIADNSFIKNGSKGILCIFEEGFSKEYIDFNIRYKICLPFIPDSIISINIGQRLLFKPFIGADIKAETGDFTRYVYITATGTVYHTSPYCSYLKHYYEVIPDSEKDVTWSTAKGYTPCPHCSFNEPIGPTSFLCLNSKVYHNKCNCIYLGVTVYKIPFESLDSQTLCTRCRKGGIS